MWEIVPFVLESHEFLFSQQMVDQMLDNMF